jgi:flagellar FliJ protein
MKRFRFSLQPVAVLRSHRESRAHEAFASAVHLYVESEERLQASRRRVEEFANALFAGRAGQFDASAEAQLLAGYRRETEAEMEAERAMIAARDAMNQRRGEYLDAHRQLEVVKRLETKARERHQAGVHREEQAEFDDFSGRTAARRRAATVS